MRYFQVTTDLFALRQGGDKVGLANAAIASMLLGMTAKNECRATQSGLVINNLGQMVTCPSLLEAGYYHADDLPMFDDNWLEQWRTNRAFVRFKECGLRNCQAREFVFRELFGRPDPFSAAEFEKFLNR
jgi:hypothetical protein